MRLPPISGDLTQLLTFHSLIVSLYPYQFSFQFSTVRKWWPSFCLWPLYFNLIPGSNFSHFLWDLTPKVFYSVSPLTTFLLRSTYYKHTGVFHPQIWTVPPPHSTLSLNFCLFNQTTRQASLRWLFSLHISVTQCNTFLTQCSLLVCPYQNTETTQARLL